MAAKRCNTGRAIAANYTAIRLGGRKTCSKNEDIISKDTVLTTGNFFILLLINRLYL